MVGAEAGVLEQRVGKTFRKLRCCHEQHERAGNLHDDQRRTPEHALAIAFGSSWSQRS
jgi:hypothetical protein